MERNKNSDQAIESALDYLRTQQRSDGSFLSFSSHQKQPFSADFEYRTTFTPALILAALGDIETPVAIHIRSGLVDFLLQQKSQHWSFNYWVRHSKEVRDMPYPDDLDDTFCALIALWSHDPSTIDAAVLANMVKLLIATESHVGGPYHTWLVPADSPKIWRDVDIAVNANVAYFVSKVSRSLPRLTAFMDQAIEKHNFQSPYYPHEYPVIYYLARAYDGALKTRLANYIVGKRQSNGTWETPLQTALAVSSLLKLGMGEVERAIRYLHHSQQADGSWPAEAFCLDPKRDGKAFYSGASVLTTALVAEALCSYRRQTNIVGTIEKSSIQRESLSKMHVVRAVTKDLALLEGDLRTAALDALRHTIGGKNSEEIILLPRLFYESQLVRAEIPKNLFTNLGKANLYGWLAYTIYDDLLDSEGNPRLLSVANAMLRRSVDAFWRALPNRQFYEFVHQTFDMIDAANIWELTHCRFVVSNNMITIGELPKYGRLNRLAERSFGHALTPLAVMAASGRELTDEATKSLKKAFYHYLIARQLSDDIHDWKADFQAGRISYVVAVLLKELELQPREYRLVELLPQAERQFWHYTLPRISGQMTRHTIQSHKAIERSGVLRQNSILAKLLDDIDSSIAETETALTQIKNFLNVYNDHTRS